MPPHRNDFIYIVAYRPVPVKVREPQLFTSKQHIFYNGDKGRFYMPGGLILGLSVALAIIMSYAIKDDIDHHRRNGHY